MVPRNIPYFETKPALDHPLWWKNDDPTFAHGFEWMDIAFLVGFQSMGNALLPRAFPKSFWDQIQTIQMGGDSQMKTIRSPFASQVWVWFRFLGEKTPEKTPNWSRKASQWIGFTKTICRTFGWKIIWRWAITEHQLARNICKKPMAPWHSSQAKNSPFHQLTSRDHLEIPPGDAKGPAMARWLNQSYPKITIWFSKTHQNSPKLDLLSLLMSTSCDWTSQISTRNQPGVPPRPALP